MNKYPLPKRKIKIGTKFRLFFLFCALINQVLFTVGIAPQNISYLKITLCSTILSSLISYWKNNSFSRAAIEGDSVMDSLKSSFKS